MSNKRSPETTRLPLITGIVAPDLSDTFKITNHSVSAGDGDHPFWDVGNRPDAAFSTMYGLIMALIAEQAMIGADQFDPQNPESAHLILICILSVLYMIAVATEGKTDRDKIE